MLFEAPDLHVPNCPVQFGEDPFPCNKGNGKRQFFAVDHHARRVFVFRDRRSTDRSVFRLYVARV